MVLTDIGARVSKELKKKYLIIMLILLFLTPLTELWLLTIVIPPEDLRLEIGWQDLSLRSSYDDPVWLDRNFTEGWQVRINTDPSTSGFEVRNGMGVLFANFKGELTRIEIEKSIGKVDTTVYPYLVITHRENASDDAINFSFGITDEKGVFYEGGWYHASTNETNLEYDLRKLYNGIITKISIRLTNDFNIKFAGGVCQSWISLVAIYKYAPEWKMAVNIPVDAEVCTQNGTLIISSRGITPLNTIVAAQKVGGFNFNLTTYGYLKVSIKTSSLHVAARIVVWTEDGKDHLILLKTYNDNSWHTEIIYLRSFEIYESRIIMLQLGFIIVESGDPSPQVCYKELSFIRWSS